MKTETDSEWRREIAASILMAVATVATTWCAYQATVWGGIQTFRITEASAAGREGASLWLKAQQERALDAPIFMAERRNHPLARTYSS